MTISAYVIPKKLIEVALPLEDINKAAAREKSIRKGHPSTFHLWWARRPLAAARAVIFAQMVNDPAWKYSDEELKKPQVRSAITRRRNELFRLIAALVQWENSGDESVLSKARAAIVASWRETCEANKGVQGAEELFDPEKIPPLCDPFAGGGSIPLEAQRLGLTAFASDLNPVATLINKGLVEIPAKFAGRSPVGPVSNDRQQSAPGTATWAGPRGLAEDVMRYARWMNDQAFAKIGHLYPSVRVTKAMVKERADLKRYENRDLTVIAWLWVRTVASPNPAVRGAEVPLVGTFLISQGKGKEAWVDPVVEGRSYRFVVKTGAPRNRDKVAEGTKTARGANFRCLLTGAPIPEDYVKAEGKAGRFGWRLLAVVAEGERQRVFLSPTEEQEALAKSCKPAWRPDAVLSTHPQYMSVTNYGPKVVGDLFMDRQTVALNTFADLVPELRRRVRSDAVAAGWSDDGRGLASGGFGASGYADAIATYCALGVSKLANRQSTNTFWHTSGLKIEQVFARQALPMIWDTAEGNPFSTSSGNFLGQVEYMTDVIANLPLNPPAGFAEQEDARRANVDKRIVSTDPPYFDNVPYADLSDFFYVWLRRSLRSVFPELFTTIAAPKDDELVADHKRHKGRENAEAFFLDGMSEVFRRVSEHAHPAVPVTVYYAFRQSETDESGTSSTGWETFLQAVVDSGLGISATWPVRTELVGNLKKNWNALASSIILACHRRPPDALTVSRKEFSRELERVMPIALADMTADPLASIAPVDLHQASIGPGMAVYSKYKAVLEADGSSMPVRVALVHINKAIDDFLARAEGEVDADTRFCMGWFQQYGFDAGPFGEADVLARAKGTAVDGVAQDGVLKAGRGRVQLSRIAELPAKWDPERDGRLTVWEACHQLCRALQDSENEAGHLLAKMPEKQDSVRHLAYRLYSLCERKGWAEEARPYNDLIASWPAIVEASQRAGLRGEQLGLVV
jgi:putative DNA methylase